MSDTGDTTPAQREAEWTRPLDVMVGEPGGPVLYAEVYDEQGLAGFVWIARRSAERPRAGIVVLHERRRGDPSVAFQEDLGYVTTAIRNDGTVDPDQFMDLLAETRTGQAAERVAVGEALEAGSLADVRALAS